jgi:hypothetical protein
VTPFAVEVLFDCLRDAFLLASKFKAPEGWLASKNGLPFVGANAAWPRGISRISRQRRR